MEFADEKKMFAFGGRQQRFLACALCEFVQVGMELQNK